MWRNVIINSSIIGIGLIGSKAFIFLYRIILARHLSVDDYAAFALLTTFFSWLLLFTHFDLHSSLSHYIAKYRNRLNSNDIWPFFFTILSLIGILSLFSISAGIFITYKISLPFWVVFIFFFGLFFNSVIVATDGLFKGLGKYSLSAQVELSNGASRFFLFYMALLIFPSVALNFILCLFSIALLIPLFISILFASKFQRPSINDIKLVKLKHAKEALTYSKWILLTDISNTGLILITTIFLSLFSLLDVSQYNLVIIFFSIFQFSFGAIVSVLIPEISNRLTNNKNISLPNINILYLMVVLILGASIFLSFFQPIQNLPALIFNKPDYSHVLSYLLILSISIPFKIFTISYKGIVQGTGDTKTIAMISVLVLLVYLSFLFPMYKYFKLNGIFVAMILSYIIEFFLTKVHIHRRLPRKPQ